MARLRDIVIDAAHPAGLARFWAGALDEYAVRAYDEAEIERLARLGLTPETDPSVAVDGPGPTLFFQKVAEPAAGRNRIHFDIAGSTREAEIARLQVLGASVREVQREQTVMLDPEGNSFCVRDPD